MPTDRPRVASGRWIVPLVCLAVGGVLGFLGRGLLEPERPPHPGTTGSPPGVAQAPEANSEEDAALLSFWSSAAFGLASRSAELEDLLARMQAEDRDPEAVLKRAIDGASDQELATLISAVTRIDAGELLADGDLRPLARRLAEVALDDLNGPSRELAPETSVYFATSTGEIDEDVYAAPAFPADVDRIFARFELPEYDGEGVLVKWLNQDSRRIHSLQRLPYPTRGPLWSSLSKSFDWEAGDYQVTVYSQDKEMTPLAQGGFTVAAETSDGPP